MKLLHALSTRKAWRAGLLLLVVVRLGMWWLFQHDIPKLIDHYQWQFYYGGDETLFFNRAQGLVSGEYTIGERVQSAQSTVGIGLPFMMAGLILFTGKNAYDAILPFLVIGNGLLFAAVSVAVMASWARLLTGSRLQGLIVGIIWTLLPYVLWLGFGIHPQAEVLRNAYVSRQMWVSGVTDSPSMFFVTLGMLLALHAAHKPANMRWQAGNIWVLAAGGLCIGFAAAIRIHVLPVAVVMLFAMLVVRRWREVLVVLGGMLAGFMPQLWHNQVANGCFLDQPYINGWLHFDKNCSLRLDVTSMPFSPGHLLENITSLVSRLPLATIAAFILLLIAAFAFFRCWQMLGPESTLIMFGGPAASLGLHVVTFVYSTDPIRFTLPAASFGLSLGVWLCFWIINEVRRYRESRTAYTRKVSGV